MYGYFFCKFKVFNLLCAQKIFLLLYMCVLSKFSGGCFNFMAYLIRLLTRFQYFKRVKVTELFFIIMSNNYIGYFIAFKPKQKTLQNFD